MIFFFLRDQERILNWFLELLPRDNARDNELVMRVWGDVDAQIGNYIRGKFWEILIVWLVTFVCFTWFGLQFAMLLSVLVGLSVLIPYVGAAVVTIPVVLIAWFQWGWSGEFAYVVAAYLVIQALDGNLLAPLLFAEVVNIHPVAIIVAVLFFGGLWGLMGRVLRHPACHAGAGGDRRLAEIAERGRARMKRVYTAESLIDGQLVVDLLARAGVPSILFNQNAGGGLGELPVTHPEVWLKRDLDHPPRAPRHRALRAQPAATTRCHLRGLP